MGKPYYPSPESMNHPPKFKPLLTSSSFEFCLKVALIYPILFSIFSWLVSDEMMVDSTYIPSVV